MQSRKYRVLVMLAAVLALFAFTLNASAQDNSALIRQAIAAIGTNCANLSADVTCLAHPGVARTVSAGIVSPTYTAAGDRASIFSTHQIQTSVLDATTGDFGVNVMNVGSGANSLVYVAFDGATLTNRGTGASIWKDFDLSIAAGSAMPFLMVQSPEGVKTTLTINGATVTIGSTVLIWFSLDANGKLQIEVTVVFGSLFTPNAINVVTCETSAAPFSNNLVGPFGSPVGGIFPAGVSYLDIFPGNVLHYLIAISTPSGVGGVGAVCSEG